MAQQGVVLDGRENKVENAAGELVVHVEDTGSGIGLAIAKEIVQYHDGTISVNSVVGKGTRFTFTLPLYQLDSMTMIDTRAGNFDQDVE